MSQFTRRETLYDIPGVICYCMRSPPSLPGGGILVWPSHPLEPDSPGNQVKWCPLQSAGGRGKHKVQQVPFLEHTPWCGLASPRAWEQNAPSGQPALCQSAQLLPNPEASQPHRRGASTLFPTLGLLLKAAASPFGCSLRYRSDSICFQADASACLAFSKGAAGAGEALSMSLGSYCNPSGPT